MIVKLLHLMCFARFCPEQSCLEAFSGCSHSQVLIPCALLSMAGDEARRMLVDRPID